MKLISSSLRHLTKKMEQGGEITFYEIGKWKGRLMAQDGKRVVNYLKL